MELFVKSHSILLDPTDYQSFKDKTISINNRGYAMNAGKLIHRTIMNCQADKVIDHINQNKLDNRTANLRVCSIGENNLNRSLSSASKTGLTGVHYYKPNNKYVAYISKDKKRYHLGYFDTKEDAYYKYCAVAKLLHGEFSADRIKAIKVEPCEIKPKEYKSPQYVLEYYRNNKEKKSKQSVIRLIKMNGKRPKDTTIQKHKITDDEIQECIEIFRNS